MNEKHEIISDTEVTQVVWHFALDAATSEHKIDWRSVAEDMLEHARQLEFRLRNAVEAYERQPHDPERNLDLSWQMSDSRAFLTTPHE